MTIRPLPEPSCSEQHRHLGCGSSGCRTCGRYETELYRFLETRRTALLGALADKKYLDENMAAMLDAALEEFATVFQAPQMLAAA